MIPAGELRPRVYVRRESVLKSWQRSGALGGGRLQPVVGAAVVVPVLDALAPEADTELYAARLGGVGRHREAERESVVKVVDGRALHAAGDIGARMVLVSVPPVVGDAHPHFLAVRHVLHFNRADDALVRLLGDDVLQAHTVAFEPVPKRDVVGGRLRKSRLPLVHVDGGRRTVGHVRQEVVLPARWTVRRLGHHFDVLQGEALVVGEHHPLLVLGGAGDRRRAEAAVGAIRQLRRTVRVLRPQN